MKVMEGEFKTTLPHKGMNIHNLTLKCKCKFITLREMEDRRIQFLMEARCLKHILKYKEWKLKNMAVPLNGLELNYTYDIYEDGTTGVID